MGARRKIGLGLLAPALALLAMPGSRATPVYGPHYVAGSGATADVALGIATQMNLVRPYPPKPCCNDTTKGVATVVIGQSASAITLDCLVVVTGLPYATQTPPYPLQRNVYASGKDGDGHQWNLRITQWLIVDQSGNAAPQAIGAVKDLALPSGFCGSGEIQTTRLKIGGYVFN